MPREVLTLQFGQCGNQIGSFLWGILVEEHIPTARTGVNRPQEKTEVAAMSLNECAVFDEGTSSVFRIVDARNLRPGGPMQQLKARALLIDMEEGVVNRILRGPISSLFDDTLLITDVSGAGNNWAYGHEVYGTVHSRAIVETISRALEECDSPQAFLFLHSLGGGTGSGLGTKCLEMMADLHPQLARLVCAVSPGEMDDVVTSPYNAVLALHELRQHATCAVPVCNDALTQRTLTLGTADDEQPFAHANGYVAQMLAHLTSSVRFSGPLDVDLQDISSNLVPYKGLQFLSSAVSPLGRNIGQQQKVWGNRHARGLHASQPDLNASRSIPSCADLLLDNLRPSSQLLDVHPKRSVCLTAAFMFRGQRSIGEVVQKVERVKRFLHFPWFCRGSIKLGLCSVPPSGQATSLLSLLNSCEIRHHFRRVLMRFQKLYARRAHLHHYTKFMDKELFNEAADSLESLLEDYSHLNTYHLPPTTYRKKYAEPARLLHSPVDHEISDNWPLI